MEKNILTPIEKLVNDIVPAVNESASDYFQHVIIDLETLSLRTDAAIVSIGAVALDEDLEVCGQFYCPVDVSACLNYKMSVDAATLRWWLTQEKEAQNALLYEAAPLSNALMDFKCWLNHGHDGCETWCHIWANGPEFDCAVLNSAYHRIFPRLMESTAIWNYQNVQSIRTLWLLNEELKLGCKYIDSLPKHNALFDAYREAMFVRDVYRALDKYCF